MSSVPLSTQSQSNFFVMLPPEIRLLIYALALQGEPDETLELTLLDDPHRPSFSVKYAHDSFPLSPPHIDQLLSLPKTCRLAYAECIHEFYARNTLSTNQLGCILFLPSALAPPLFQTIRALSLRCYARRRYCEYSYLDPAPDDEATWEAAWAVVAGMRGLKSLRVHIWQGHAFGLHGHHWSERQLLEPLTAIHGADSFIVTTSWVLDHTTPVEYRERCWPFQIQRGIIP
ncbi:uncharacterized protein BDZ99DRAFT_519198 [Mytilinidion resinicola]|uniref:DUF7730 domain-containing protein n=1 Tax=Mytilinidion resinicola TaxID=574789 RepID=A0A6A6YTQ7_9PEZI|nr:uncharacterized protein BDZ99DRAFT_519198 [Mytilinidion resinicola]KAF2811958.1 hypothetical protein BDZ99DRAFT_519198 [Mytilinidion resinicola]